MAQQVLEKRLNLESMRRRGDLDPEEELATGSSGSSTIVPGMSHTLATTTVNIHKTRGWSACASNGSASVSSIGVAPASRTNTNPSSSVLSSSNMVMSNTNQATTNGHDKVKERTANSGLTSSARTNAFGSNSNSSSTQRSTSDQSIITNNSGNSMLTNGSGPSSSVNSLERGTSNANVGNSRSAGACFCFFSVALVKCFVCPCLNVLLLVLRYRTF